MAWSGATRLPKVIKGRWLPELSEKWRSTSGRRLNPWWDRQNWGVQQSWGSKADVLRSQKSCAHWCCNKPEAIPCKLFRHIWIYLVCIKQDNCFETATFERTYPTARPGTGCASPKLIPIFTPELVQIAVSTSSRSTIVQSWMQKIGYVFFFQLCNSVASGASTRWHCLYKNSPEMQLVRVPDAKSSPALDNANQQ